MAVSPVVAQEGGEAVEGPAGAAPGPGSSPRKEDLGDGSTSLLHVVAAPASFAGGVQATRTAGSTSLRPVGRK